jgi:hypothetical protein
MGNKKDSEQILDFTIGAVLIALFCIAFVGILNFLGVH